MTSATAAFRAMARAFPAGLATLAVVVTANPALGAAQAPESEAPDFFDAALCKPPYTFASAQSLYEAAEKVAKPDMSKLGAAIYDLPGPIGKDGFASNQVVFANSTVGVLVQGAVATELAARYQLAPETSNLLGTSSKGYARALPKDQQPLPDMGVVSIIARESPGLPGKTLLACEFASNEDIQALKRFEAEMKP